MMMMMMMIFSISSATFINSAPAGQQQVRRLMTLDAFGSGFGATETMLMSQHNNQRLYEQ